MKALLLAALWAHLASCVLLMGAFSMLLLAGVPDVAFVHFGQRDVVRHKLVQLIVEAYRVAEEGRAR